MGAFKQAIQRNKIYLKHNGLYLKLISCVLILA